MLAPIAGIFADRFDRRRLVQLAQALELITSGLLVVLTFTNTLTADWIYVATAISALAVTFDGPARQSLIPALVPRERLIDAYALITPIHSVSRLIGPAIAGLLIAAWGVGAVYVFDVVTFAAFILTMALLRFARAEAPAPQAWWPSLVEGYRYIRGRPLIWQLMALDLSAVFFAAYRVLLPALARDVFAVGAVGYGFLASAPSVGGIVGAAILYRIRNVHRKGLLTLGATIGYGFSAAALGYAPSFGIALVLAGGLGLFDAICTAIRHAVIQIETPDRLRGRVTALYGMSARGGSSLGLAQMGLLASAIGAPLALAVGGALTVGYAFSLAWRGTTIRDYRT